MALTRGERRRGGGAGAGRDRQDVRARRGPRGLAGQRRAGVRLCAVGEGRGRAARPGGHRHHHDRPAHLRARPRRAAGRTARCWSSTRPAWSARATSPACSTRPSRRRPSSSSSATIASCPRSRPAGCSRRWPPARGDRADREPPPARGVGPRRARRAARRRRRRASPAPTTSTAGSWRRPSADAARAALVDDWVGPRPSAASQALMIAHRRADVADLNRRARERMRAAGRLGDDAARRPAGAPSPSATVSWTTRNDGRLGIVNGDSGTLTPRSATGR